jgi:hypothetical protein
MAVIDHITRNAPTVESLIALAERLRRRAARAQHHGGFQSAVDLRMASGHLRRLASILARVEALNAPSHYQRTRLQNEADQLWSECER